MVGMPRISCFLRGAEPCIIMLIMLTIMLTLLITVRSRLILLILMFIKVLRTSRRAFGSSFLCFLVFGSSSSLGCTS